MFNRNKKSTRNAAPVAAAPAPIYFSYPPLQQQSVPLTYTTQSAGPAFAPAAPVVQTATIQTAPFVQTAPVMSAPVVGLATEIPPVLNAPNLQYVGSNMVDTRGFTTMAPTTVYTAPITSTYLTSSYTKVLRRIHLLNEAMVRLSQERIALDVMDAKGLRVLQELNVVLGDIEAFLLTKNGDLKFQQLADHFFTLAGELRNDRELAAFANSWKASKSGDQTVDGMINNVSLLFHDIKASRNIYAVFAEGLKMAENMLNGEEDDQADMEAQKKRVYEEVIELLKGIGQNPRWKAITGDSTTAVQSLNERARNAGRPHLHLKQRPAYEMMMYDLKRAIEVLMVDHDGATVERLFQSVEKFLSDAAHSETYRQFIIDAKEAGTEIMEDPEILEDPATRELLWKLWNTFVEMLSEVKKNPAFLEAVKEAKHIFKSLSQDPAARNIINHATVLLKDIHQNEQGKLMDFSLIPQFKHILVPLLLESFREVNIPPIQGVTPDKKLKYHIQGITLSSIEMLPENIKIEATYRMNTDPLRLDVHEKDIILWVEADKVRARVTGAAWNYERLTFPRVGDSGLASVVLGGQGARVGAKIRIHKQGNEHVMQVIDSYCHISRLDLAMYECKYAVVYRLAHKHLVAQLKSVIELAVAQKLTQLVTSLDRTVLRTIVHAQTAKNTIIKNVSLGKKKLMNKKKAKAGEPNGEKKSKKEKLLGMATSSSTKRKGLSLIKKARQTAESKTEEYPSLEEVNHRAPAAPLPPNEFPPLVAPSTNMALPPLVAPSTNAALPPLIAPSTNAALPPLVAPVTNAALPPLVAPNTNEPLPPLVAPSTNAALPPLVAPSTAPGLERGDSWHSLATITPEGTPATLSHGFAKSTELKLDESNPINNISTGVAAI